MAEKNRNFRHSYYDKVGLGIEEKKSLEILINDKSVDRDKLAKFCLRFSLPAIYREYVWKVILGVVPAQHEYQDLIMNHRNEHYQELEKSLVIMYKLAENTPGPVVHALMYQMTEDSLIFDLEKELSDTKIQSLIALSTIFIETSSSDEIAFWMFRNFLHHMKKSSAIIESNKESFEAILKKEDSQLYEHFHSCNFTKHVPLNIWFDQCFAEILHESSLPRILDKVIGGGLKILAYVAAAMMLVKRHLVLPIKDHSKMNEVLKNNSEEVSDAIVGKALEMYYKNTASSH